MAGYKKKHARKHASYVKIKWILSKGASTSQYTAPVVFLEGKTF